jgi:alkylation response protein AidB-like acyl-CoA dehydrogenase
VDVVASEAQRMLQETTRRFLEARSPIVALRRQVEGKTGFDKDAWRQGAALGWLSLFTPEAYGGLAESAQGVVDAAIIAEELGRVVFAGPFLPVNIAVLAVAAHGSETQRAALLPALSGGEQTAAWCFSGPGLASGLEPGAVRVTPAGADFVLEGTASYVEAAHLADHLLVTARGRDGGLSQFVLPAQTAGVTVQPLETLDLGRALAEVRFEGVHGGADTLLGEAGRAADAVERQLQLAVVLQCAETVGVIDRALEFTLDYVKQRVAFGRPIGSFQALKHRLADHATQLEGAKAITAYAAQVVQAGAADAAAAVSIAKSQCGRFGVEIIRDCVQLHGGIGVTWEHDIHFYLRRAVSNEALWGAPARHHDRLCRLAGL